MNISLIEELNEDDFEKHMSFLDIETLRLSDNILLNDKEKL